MAPGGFLLIPVSMYRIHGNYYCFHTLWPFFVHPSPRFGDPRLTEEQVIKSDNTRLVGMNMAKIRQLWETGTMIAHMHELFRSCLGAHLLSEEV